MLSMGYDSDNNCDRRRELVNIPLTAAVPNVNFAKWFGGDSDKASLQQFHTTKPQPLSPRFLWTRRQVLNHNRQYLLPLLVRKAGIHLLNDAIQLGDGRGTLVDYLQHFAFLERISADGLHERLDVLVRLVGARAGEEVVADLRECVSL
jgi:hypothetical protein